MRKPLLVFALVLALATAGCGGDDDAASTTSTTAEATTTSTSAATTTTTQPVATSTTSTTTSTTTTTEAPPSPPPDGAVLVTNEDGVFVATLQGVVSQVVDADPSAVGGIVHFAIDDTRGGIVVAPSVEPWLDLGDDSIVYWAPQGATALQELLVPAADQGILLEDVAARDGGVFVYYTRRSGTTPPTAKQFLRSFDLDTKDVTEVTQVGGWESGASPISVGGDTIVQNASGEAYLWVIFSDLEGNEFESPANPIPGGAFDCVPDCFYYADLSPAGSNVAFARFGANGSGFYTIPQLEVRDVASGALVLSVSLPELPAGGYIDSVDLGDTHVLINIVEEGSEFPTATVVDLATGLEVTQVPVNGVARFLRSVPNLGGVISWP